MAIWRLIIEIGWVIYNSMNFRNKKNDERIVICLIIPAFYYNIVQARVITEYFQINKLNTSFF